MEALVPAWVVAAAAGLPSTAVALLWWRVGHLEREILRLRDAVTELIRDVAALYGLLPGGAHG